MVSALACLERSAGHRWLAPGGPGNFSVPRQDDAWRLNNIVGGLQLHAIALQRARHPVLSTPNPRNDVEKNAIIWEHTCKNCNYVKSH
jgi:hypothetical protein